MTPSLPRVPSNSRDFGLPVGFHTTFPGRGVLRAEKFCGHLKLNETSKARTFEEGAEGRRGAGLRGNALKATGDKIGSAPGPQPESATEKSH